MRGEPGCGAPSLRQNLRERGVPGGVWYGREGGHGRGPTTPASLATHRLREEGRELRVRPVPTLLVLGDGLRAAASMA